ncbi:hypothetical protein B0H66DRAFT_59477 [Apodospora peruviana]|uniref:C2H2-type domain-containing protein n=1 Tax=Apodospora peruviana TaxID=516989 RepID=A0AAE0MG17_9PEZI|nr:hypothetical protein B0H66DRAFT_59477 [Apodospora peruviana]
MEGSFEPSEPFKYGRHAFHHPSQSATNISFTHSPHHNLGGIMDYSMNAALPPEQSPGNLGHLTNGGAGESHDDLCVDQCMGVGLYNGSQHFNHRGPPAGMQSGWPSRSMSSRRDPGLLYYNSFDVSAFSAPFRASVNPSHPDAVQPWYGQHLQLDHHTADDDCQSVDDDSCCDSECTMTGKCSNIACANKDDACTDQNCPSRRIAVPTEVANGAAALISITHAPEPSHHSYGLQQAGQHNFSLSQHVSPAHFNGAVMDGFGFGVSHPSHQASLEHPSFVPNGLEPIMNHVLLAHDDPNSSTCTRPCLLDDPRTYGNGNCPFPFSYNNPTQFGHLPPLDQNLQMNQDLTECGAQISNPEAFLAHFNEQHRPYYRELLSNIQDPVPDPREAQDESVLPSSETLSQSPTTPFDTSDSGASANTPSPLTPLSNSVDMSDAKPRSPSPARSTTVESSASGTVEMGPDYEHKCLWRDEGSTEVCGVSFTSSEELFNHAVNKHIKYATKGDHGFSCGWDDCPRSAHGASGFPQRSKIERHMQTHIGHKPHVCPTCKKGFSAKQALNQHMFIHTDQKPLECGICKKTFRYPSALTMHQRIHSGIKPLKCPICGKMFSESSNLSKHKRTHEVRGRFSCSVAGCNRDFHRQDQLRRHMKTHQKGNDGTSVNDDTTVLDSVF